MLNTRILRTETVGSSHFRLYRYKTNPNGNIQYRAPEGCHYDCEIALALAAWQLKRTPPQRVAV